MAELTNYNNNLRSITTGKDRKEDGQLMMSANANWGEFLIPAPYCVSLIGQLLIISSKIDFSIDKSAPAGGFKYVDNPSSFQSCLVQLSNWAYDAFNKAHKNMGGIAQHTSNYPSHLTTIVKTLLQGTDQDIEDFVGSELETLKRATDECVRLASDTENAFMKIMFLSGELLQAGSAAQGANEEQIKKNAAALNVANLQKQKMEEQNKRWTDQSKKLEANYKDTNDMYKNAINTIPSGWEMLGLNVVEGLSTMAMRGLDLGMNHLVGGQGMAMVSMMNSKKEADGASTVTGTTLPSVNPEARPEPDDAFIKSDILVMQMIALDTLTVSLAGKKAKWDEVKGGIASIEAQLKDLDTRIVKTTIPGASLAAIIAKSLQLIGELNSQASQLGDASDSTLTGYQTRLATLKLDAETFNTKGKVAVPTSTVIQGAPIISQPPPPTASSGKAAAAAMESAHFKVAQAKMLLENAREDYNKVSDKLDKNSEDLIKIVAQLGQIDLNKIEFEEIRVVLRDSIKYLGKLREEWGKIVMFFQMVSNLISITLKDKVDSFVQKAEVAENRILGGVKLSDFNKNLIYGAALEVGKVAFHVNNLASTYVEISQEHIIPRIAGISKILGIKDDPRAMRDVKKELDEGCIASQNMIRDKVNESRAAFIKNISKRIRTLETSLKESLPALPPASQEINTKAIEETKKMATAATKVSDKIAEDEQNGVVDKLPDNKKYAEVSKEVNTDQWI